MVEIGINWKEFPLFQGLNPAQPTAKPNNGECVNNAPQRKRGPPYINTGRRGRRPIQLAFHLKLRDSFPVFCGFGSSMSEARMEACKLAYKYLDDNDYLYMKRFVDLYYIWSKMHLK